MTLKTSLIIDGDTRQARVEVSALREGLSAAGYTIEATTTRSATLERAMARGAERSREAAVASNANSVAHKELGTSISTVVASTTTLAPQMQAATAAQGRMVEQQRRAIDTTGLQRAGYVQLGAQMQDVIAQASTGTSIFTIAAQQGGQFFAALAMIAPQAQQAGAATDKLTEGAGEVGQAAVDSADKFTSFSGAIGRAATFMAGPWGAIVLAATTVLGKLAWEAYNTEESLNELTATLDAATVSADAWGNAQNLLAKMMDLGTQAIKTQNTALIEHIRLQADLGIIAADKDIAKARKDLADIADPSVGEAVSLGFRAVGRGFAQGQPGAGAGDVGREDMMRRAPLRSLAREVAAGGMDSTTIRRRVDWLRATGNLKGYDEEKVLETKNRLFALPDAEGRKEAFQAVLDAQDGKGFDNRLKPYERDRKTRTPKTPSTEGRDEFGRDAAARIASMVSEFDGTPEIIDAINGRVATLDDLIEDLGRRKPPGFGDLIKSAEAAKVTIRDGLIGEIATAFDKPKNLADRAGAAIGDLDAAIADLQQRKPIDWEKSVEGANAAKGRIAAALNEPLNEYIRQQDEASQIQNLLIAGRAAEAEALEVVLRLERERGPLSDQQKAAVRESVDQRREEAAALDRLNRRQSVYLDAVRETRDVIEQSVQALVRGDIKELMATPAKLIEAYQQTQGRKLFEGLFGDSFAELERVLTEGPVDKASRRMASGMDTATAAVEQLGKAAIGAATEIATGEPAEITVNGTRPPQTSVDDVFRKALGGVAEDIAKLFTSDALAEEIGARIGAVGAQAMKGAATGRTVGTFADQLGYGHIINGTGSMMGGAAGQGIAAMFGATLTPLGSILASVAGGLIGSMFEGPTRSGYSSIGTDANGTATTAISGGRNSEGRQKESLTYADAVLDGLAKIAGGLGGRLGSGLDLGTIGTQGDKYVFDSDGSGSAAGIKVDTLDEAVRAALSSAIGKGAVTGLSDAVRKALGSSSDVDKALAEALKVKQLETLIGGVGGQVRAMLEEFDNAAAERVRVAKAYGLDLVAVEKRNGEERADLLDDMMKSRVGSLQALLDDMRYGDLFEGDASERRTQILSEIEEAKQDATAGIDGAGDRLAELYRLLMDTTRENYGTAGDQLAADRGLAASGAADIIKREAERLNGAAVEQKATTAAVVQSNKLLDELVDQQATMNARLNQIAASVGAPLTGQGAMNFAAVVRQPEQ